MTPDGFVAVNVTGFPFGVRLSPDVVILERARGTSRYGTRSETPPPVSSTLPLTSRKNVAPVAGSNEAPTLLAGTSSVTLSVAWPPAGTVTDAAPNETVAGRVCAEGTAAGVRVTGASP